MSGTIKFLNSNTSLGNRVAVGVSSLVGPTGAIGLQGPMGYGGGGTGGSGFQGPQGLRGATGSQGLQGYIGPQGGIGPIGGIDGQVLFNFGGIATGSANATMVSNVLNVRDLIISNRSIHLGLNAGLTNQNTGSSIAIGPSAGQTNQSGQTVAIGDNAGNNTQSQFGVAVGYYAGSTSQGGNTVAIGTLAGNNTQSSEAIAIGHIAGNNRQGPFSIAMGYFAGSTGQGSNSIAIGQNAGYGGLGTNSIAIGTNAGPTGQASNSILLNASGLGITPSTTGFFVKPIREVANSYLLYFNSGTNEITYGISGGGGIQGLPGPTGPSNPGVQGYQGNLGLQGLAGPTGTIGATGPSNPGVQGYQGNLGLQGVQGIAGAAIGSLANVKLSYTRTVDSPAFSTAGNKLYPFSGSYSGTYNTPTSNIIFNSTGGSFTVLQQGDYYVDARLIIKGSNNPDFITTDVYVNTGTVYNYTHVAYGIVSPVAFPIGLYLPLNVGDTVNMACYTTGTAGSITIKAGTTMNIHRLTNGPTGPGLNTGLDTQVIFNYAGTPTGSNNLSYTGGNLINNGPVTLGNRLYTTPDNPTNGMSWFGLKNGSEPNNLAIGFGNTGSTSVVDNIRFLTFGNEAMKVTNNGYVGIGTSTPSYLLHVNGNISPYTINRGNPGKNNTLLLDSFNTTHFYSISSPTGFIDISTTMVENAVYEVSFNLSSASASNDDMYLYPNSTGYGGSTFYTVYQQTSATPSLQYTTNVASYFSFDFVSGSIGWDPLGKITIYNTRNAKKIIFTGGDTTAPVHGQGIWTNNTGFTSTSVTAPVYDVSTVWSTVGRLQFGAITFSNWAIWVKRIA